MNKLLKKIPGFRSGRWWKKVIASVVYFFLFLIILTSIFPSAPTLALDKIDPTNKSSLSISGKTFAGKPVFLLKENQIVQQTKGDSQGKFYFSLNDLKDGHYSYTVEACNNEKREKCKSENILVVVDQTPPSKPLIALPEVLPEDSEEEIIIKGETEPNSKVIASVQGKELPPVESNEKGEFEIKTGLVLGANTVNIKAIDSVGNESETVQSSINFNPQRYTAKVVRVIDGDTIEIEGGVKVRYIGIDTPETVDPRKPVQCFGKEASAKNEELAGGKEVKLEKDVSETDKYGRLLRYVWVGDLLVNEYLVKEGYAQVSTYPPDVKYQERFLAAQKEARENNRGLWGACSYFGQPAVIPSPKPTPTPKPLVPSPKPTFSPQPPPSGGGGYNCSANVYNCSDFQYQEDAQYVFEYCGGVGNDVHVLDNDKDGVACETLPKRGSGSQSSPQPTPQQSSSSQSSGGGRYVCDCSKTCEQISSCEEAQYLLNVCGCSARDRDGDGIACDAAPLHCQR